MRLSAALYALLVIGYAILTSGVPTSSLDRGSLVRRKDGEYEFRSSVPELSVKRDSVDVAEKDAAFGLFHLANRDVALVQEATANDKCAVCLEKKSELVSKCHAKHETCLPCMEELLERNSVCPVCRGPLNRRTLLRQCTPSPPSSSRLDSSSSLRGSFGSLSRYPSWTQSAPQVAGYAATAADDEDYHPPPERARPHSA